MQHRFLLMKTSWKHDGRQWQNSEDCSAFEERPTHDLQVSHPRTAVVFWMHSCFHSLFFQRSANTDKFSICSLVNSAAAILSKAVKSILCITNCCAQCFSDQPLKAIICYSNRTLIIFHLNNTPTLRPMYCFQSDSSWGIPVCWWTTTKSWRKQRNGNRNTVHTVHTVDTADIHVHLCKQNVHSPANFICDFQYRA